MDKVNFGIISKALEVLDTDKMDIGRRVEIENPDGTTGETNPENPIYTNIPCHISFVSADNPDSNSVDTKPIITGLRINCSLDVDLQNGDYITASKLNASGEVLEVYKGIIGFPTVTESRKSAEMEMRTDV
jgi:hypothetical protein